MDLKLEQLRDAVSTLNYAFNKLSTPKNAREILAKLNSAKANLKRYKQKNYPELLVNINPYKPTVSNLIRMSDWAENFEEYGQNN